MRNSNAVIKLIAVLFLVGNVFLSGLNAQMGNPEELIVSAQGYNLKAKHALAMLTFMQQQGSLSQNPTEYEIQTVLQVLIQEFQEAPRETIQELENVQQLIFGSTTPHHSQPTQPVQQQSNGGIYNQQQAESEMARVYKNHMPHAVIDYNNAQAMQVKSALGGMLLVNSSSKTYNSGTGDNYFGMTTASSMDLHVCPNGIMTIVSSSRMMGGGQGSSIDSGGSGSNLQCWWSVAVVNGQLCLMTADERGVDALPLFIENGSVIISEKRYTLNPGQAQCF